MFHFTDSYKCVKCGTNKCKLYREYGDDIQYCNKCCSDLPEPHLSAIQMPNADLGGCRVYTWGLNRACFASEENYQEYLKREKYWQELPI